MAESVLNGLLKGELHHSTIISSLSSNLPIMYKDVTVDICEFIPHFMAFLRARLLHNNDQQGCTKAYFSPRQKEEQRKAERTKFKVAANTPNSRSSNVSGATRSARISLQYACSSPMKAFNGGSNHGNNSYNNLNNSAADTTISGISPIKNTEQNSKRNSKSRNGKKSSRMKTKPATNFEINSFEDFPSIPLGGGGGGAGAGGASNKNPRRITATTVGMMIRSESSKNGVIGGESNTKSVIETKSTKRCVIGAESSSNGVLEIESSEGSILRGESGSKSVIMAESSNNGVTGGNSIDVLQTIKGGSSSSSFNESSFLEGSCFEIQNADTSFESLFQGDVKRFISNNNKNCENSLDPPVDISGLSIHNGRTDVTPTKAKADVLSAENITEKETLNVLSQIYSHICKRNLVPNVTLEIYFLFTLLTARASGSDTRNTERFAPPFLNIECVVYFAVACLESLKQIVVMLDTKSLMLLFENSRLQQFTSSHFLEYLEKEITTEESFNLSLNSAAQVKSPNTGIAFQTDSDNRKSFISDRHFYSFSKKRDAFYSLVREWEENLGDPEFNLTAFLTRKVGEVIKMRDGLNNDFQFARLFIAQLVEMHKNQVGDKTEEPETSDGVLLELKKRDPIRFQSLQNRLTGPSSTCDPCPNLSFSKVEEFFKEFIRIADSYMLNKSLAHVLLLKIKSGDSCSFGLNQQISAQLNKSDFSDTLWQDIKATIVELRLYAKFLGFILFSPYNSMADNAELACTRNLLSEPLHLTSFLKDAFANHRLVMTVPWVVDLLSLADKKAFLVNFYMEPLNYLLFLYKQLSSKLANCSSSFVLNFTLTLHIGWLFDQNPTDGINFYQSNLNGGCHVANGVDMIGLDDIVVGDKAFVYILCPYLKVIKRPLSDFKKKVVINNTRSFRKITPVRSTEILHIDTKANLKNKLLDGFMKYVPNHIKDCMNYVTDRLFFNVKHHICEALFTSAQEDGMKHLKEKFCDIIDDGAEWKKDSLKTQNKGLYLDCLEKSLFEAKRKCQEYIPSYLANTIESTMKCLLPQDTDPKMVEVSSKVVRHNVSSKIQEWLIANRDIYTSGFDALYNRHLNHVIKTNREDSMLSFEETF